MLYNINRNHHANTPAVHTRCSKIPLYCVDTLLRRVYVICHE